MERLAECPVCGDGERLVASRHGRDFAGQAVHACLGCGVFYQSPRPTAGELERYYEGEYSRRFRGREEPTSADLDWRDRIAEHRFQHLQGRGLLSAGESLLEIGCGAGNFLSLCAAAGLDVWGVEPSRGYAEQARHQGLAVETGMFPQLQGGRSRYHTIALFHVVEHLADPLAVLRRCRELLEEGGRVVVEVPDLARALGPTFTERYFHYPHLFDFTAESLDGLLRRAGLNPRWRHYPGGGRRSHHRMVGAEAVATAEAVPALAPAARSATRRLTGRVRRRVALAVALRPLREWLRRTVGR